MDPWLLQWLPLLLVLAVAALALLVAAAGPAANADAAAAGPAANADAAAAGPAAAANADAAAAGPAANAAAVGGGRAKKLRKKSRAAVAAPSPADDMTLREDLWRVDRIIGARLKQSPVAPVGGDRVQYAWLFAAAAAALDRRAPAPAAPPEHTLAAGTRVYRGAAAAEFSLERPGPELRVARPLRLASLGPFFDVCDLEAWLAAGDPAFRRTAMTRAVMSRDVDCAKLAAAARARGYDGVLFGAGATFDRPELWLALAAPEADLAPAETGAKKAKSAPAPAFDPREFGFNSPPPISTAAQLNLALYDLRAQSCGVAPIGPEFWYPHLFGAAAETLARHCAVAPPAAARLGAGSVVYGRADRAPRYYWRRPVDECEARRAKRPLRLAEMYALYNVYDLEAWLASRDPAYRRGAKTPLALLQDVDARALLAAARAQGFDGCYVGSMTFFNNLVPLLLLDAADLEPAGGGAAPPVDLTLGDGSRI